MRLGYHKLVSTVAFNFNLRRYNWARQYLKHRDNFAEAYVMDPEIICAAWDMVDRAGDKPSSGLVGIAWAMRMCRSVDVYGFQFDAYFNATMRPHYYDWERPKPGREHAHPFEVGRCCSTPA